MLRHDQLELRQLLAQGLDFGVLGARRQALLFFLQLAGAALDALQYLFQVADTGLLHLRLLARFGCVLVEFIPALLPVVHRLFGQHQGLAGTLLQLLQQCHFRCQRGQLALPAAKLRTVVAQVGLGLGEPGGSLLQVVAQLAAALLLVLEGLFEAGDLRTQRIVGRLHLVEGIGAVSVFHPVLLDRGVYLLVFRMHRLESYLQLADRLAGGPDLAVKLPPLQGLQLGLQLAFLGLEFSVFLGRRRLPLQVLELALELVAQIGEALEVFRGTAHAALGFLAPLLVLGDTRGLLDKHPQVLRPGLDQP